MKTLTGTVVSAKMTKSARVEVAESSVHPKYKKIVTTKKVFIVDNNLNAVQGDKVVITETRPMSKLKSFAITTIIK